LTTNQAFDKMNHSMTKVLAAVFIMLTLTGASVVKHPVEYVRMQLELQLDETLPFRQWNISYPVPDKEVHCLALNVYFEAGNQETDGQYAVADVVMYRVNHSGYPDTICTVIKKGIYVPWLPQMPLKWKCHFTWFCDRKPDEPIDTDAFEAAITVANTVINDPYYVPVIDYALYYHADYVIPIPYWAEDKKIVTVIGTHLFY
jgi:spore germination cell wall hydrolase CwlJ-like protein